MLLEESMKLADQEERELVIGRGITCLGDPAITMILDWVGANTPINTHIVHLVYGSPEQVL